MQAGKIYWLNMTADRKTWLIIFIDITVRFSVFAELRLSSGNFQTGICNTKSIFKVKETEFSLREPQQTCEFGKEDGIKGIRPIYRSNRLTETFPLIYGSTYLIQRLLHQNCSLLWFVRLFRVVPDCFDWELTDGNRVRGSLNSVYNHYGIVEY